MNPEPVWVDTERKLDEALITLAPYKVTGLDTEFYGCDITEQSPAYRAQCHVLSLAAPTGARLPRGFTEASSFVISGDLLAHRGLKDWLEDPGVIKAVHNLPVDHHCLRNRGIKLAGGENTLEMARWWWPERAKRRGFDLGSLGEDILGVGKTESFTDLLGFDAMEPRERTVTKRRCACGALGCRKRSGGHEYKTDEQVTEQYLAKVRAIIPLTELKPGHELWARYLAYAAQDAVLALWLYELMMRDNRERPYPWSLM